MQGQSDAHAIVYQVLDEVIVHRCVPTGARAAIFTVVDELRAATPDGDQARRAERISIQMHKLEWALRDGDNAAVDTAHKQLKSLAAEWIDSRICSRH